jgi:hypothetical protein
MMSEMKVLTHTQLQKFFKKIENTLLYAHMRWQDEREYEDINDYAKAFIPAIEEADFTFLKMTKRPFGFQFTAESRKDTFKFQVYCNSQQAGIKQLK